MRRAQATGFLSTSLALIWCYVRWFKSDIGVKYLELGISLSGDIVHISSLNIPPISCVFCGSHDCQLEKLILQIGILTLKGICIYALAPLFRGYMSACRDFHSGWVSIAYAECQKYAKWVNWSDGCGAMWSCVNRARRMLGIMHSDFLWRNCVALSHNLLSPPGGGRRSCWLTCWVNLMNV